MPHAELVPGLLAIGLAALIALVVCLALGQDGTATAVYLCVLCAMTLPRYWALPMALLVALVFYAAGFLVPGWTHDPGLLLSMLAATIAVWGVQQLLIRNTQLVAAEKENQRLAVSEERNRLARDLHDILGHSLTVITVKAELANKLMDVDPARARAELGDLERLSRDALADVRRAVEGYRELSLPGELARARMALEAAEIEADLPNSTDEVPSDKRELFAWTIREGVTNVIRHSPRDPVHRGAAPGPGGDPRQRRRVEQRREHRRPRADRAPRTRRRARGRRRHHPLEPGFSLAVVSA